MQIGINDLMTENIKEIIKRIRMIKNKELQFNSRRK